MVDKIILTSFSLAFDASFYPDAGQQQIDAAVADLNTLGAFMVNVCFQNAAAGLNSCGRLNVAPTPEPGTLCSCLFTDAVHLGGYLPDPGQMMIVVLGDEE